MQFIGEIRAVNTSDGVFNLVCINKDSEQMNLKLEQGHKFEVNELYIFEYEAREGERVSYWITSYKKVLDLPFIEREEHLRDYYKASPLECSAAKHEIECYINKLENPIIKDITIHLIEKYKEEFFIYPAASKMHHAYIGGLAYHSIGMLHLADGLIENYPYLNKDYVYAGIMLHDIGKTIELTGAVHTEYSLRGQLLGHLVLGAMEIEAMARELGYENTDEVLMLCHMLVSHHGIPQYGACKKPMTAEALVLWYIDTIDSKFRVLGEVLENTPHGSFTDSIGVLDRQKMYKL